MMHACNFSTQKPEHQEFKASFGYLVRIYIKKKKKRKKERKGKENKLAGLKYGSSGLAKSHEFKLQYNQKNPNWEICLQFLPYTSG
jgi:hypothetical protein